MFKVLARAPFLFTLLTAAAAQSAHAQLTVVSSFASGGSSVGTGFSPADGTIWKYGDFDNDLRHYGPTGAFLGIIQRPGLGANDADVEFAPGAFTLHNVALPAGTLLYLDGESGPVDVYAANPVTGVVLATLNTAFGNSHVVGGGYHAPRGTFFFVQDRVPGGVNGNLVGEVNPQTGAVLNTFNIAAALPSFTVNYGDLDVGPNGNLFIVSSDELAILELTPVGAFVAQHTLPANIPNVSGIAIDDSACEVWLGDRSGLIFRVSHLFAPGDCAPTCDPDFTCDGNADQDDVACLISVVAGAPGCECQDPDFNRDGNVDQDDVAALINVVAGAGCP